MLVRNGFTLLELIIVVLVLAVITGMAAPAFHRLIQSQRISSRHNQLLASLYEARSEAIRRSRPVIVCNGRPATGCDDDNAWQRGWYMASIPAGASGCRDQDGDNQCDSHGGTVLRRYEMSAAGLRVNGNGIRLNSRVRFGPSGWAEGYAGTISICDANGADVEGSGIVINVSGRFRQADREDLNC